MTIFENGSPEKILQFLTNIKKSIEGTGTMKVAGRTNFLQVLLRGETFQDLDNPEIQNNGTTNTHFKEIQEGLIDYFFPMNAIIKQKRAMRRYMNKPFTLIMKRPTSRIMDLNNYLPLLPRSNDSKNKEEEELNKILLHVVPNSCSK